MTAARWTSLIAGVLILMTINLDTDDTSIWDFLQSILFMLVPCSLVIVPIVLEYLERRGGI